MVERVEDRSKNSIEALFDNFVQLGREGTPSLLVPWLAIALVDFGFVALGVLTVWLFGTADPATAGGMIAQGIGVVQMVVILAFRVALLNTLRDVALGGAEAVRDWGAVAQDVFGRFWSSLSITIVFLLIVSIGFVLCVLPGLVALFFLAFAPYLVAARGDTILDGLRRSAIWATREWALLLSAVVVAVLALGLMGCVMGLLSGVFARDVLAVPVGLAGGWLVNTIIGYLAFLWWGAVYVTAESREQMETFRETGPGGDSGPPLRQHPEDVGSELSAEPPERGPRYRPGDTSIYRVPDDDKPGPDGGGPGGGGGGQDPSSSSSSSSSGEW